MEQLREDMSLVLPTQKTYNMKEEIELPEDFVEVNREDTDYTMPNSYNSEFIEEEVLIRTLHLYRINGMGEYIGGKGVDVMKPVHLYKDMLIK